MWYELHEPCHCRQFSLHLVCLQLNFRNERSMPSFLALGTALMLLMRMGNASIRVPILNVSISPSPISSAMEPNR